MVTDAALEDPVRMVPLPSPPAAAPRPSNRWWPIRACALLVGLVVGAAGLRWAAINALAYLGANLSKTPEAIPDEVRGFLVGCGLFQVGVACAVLAICLAVPGPRHPR
jgi:hypothetical protein